MNMSKILIVVIGGLLLIAASSYPGQTVNPSDNLLNRQAKRANLKDVSAVQAAFHALLDAGVPGGVVAVNDCAEPMIHTFTPGDSSLRGALESIVSTDPRYTWEVKDEVINVLPGNGLSPFFAVRISRFEISRVETPNEALYQLLAVPEVQQAQLNLGRQAVQGGTFPFCPGGCPPKETKKISVSLKDVTVREALNAIARGHGGAVWRFTQRGCGEQKSFSLDFAALE